MRALRHPGEVAQPVVRIEVVEDTPAGRHASEPTAHKTDQHMEQSTLPCAARSDQRLHASRRQRKTGTTQCFASGLIGVVNVFEANFDVPSQERPYIELRGAREGGIEDVDDTFS